MSEAGRKLSSDEFNARAAKIRLAVFDVDGVMTDGHLCYSSGGEEQKVFHVHDGWGLKALSRNNIIPAIITARNSEMVSRRARELDIAHLIQGSDDKLAALNDLMQRLDMTTDETCYTGDDEPDLKAMETCGLAIAVANATNPIVAVAHHITQRRGGEGAVREVCDLLIGAHNA